MFLFACFTGASMNIFLMTSGAARSFTVVHKILSQNGIEKINN